jgi:Fe-S-cluster-containing hydrogenase component 2
MGNAMVFIGCLMQYFADALHGKDRPSPPPDCQRCEGKQKLHCHTTYERFAQPSGETKVVVQCYICRRCGRCFSVIPTGMLPYRSLGVKRFEAWMDNPGRSPPANKIEQGCLLRARKRLQQRIPVLCQLLGQRLPASAQGDLSTFWQALRKIASLADMLVQLAEDFKTSLLAAYRSLNFALGARASSPLKPSAS